MNAAKVTLTSTVLAAALGLALGLMSTPVQAHCDGKHTGDHRHCTRDDPIVYTAALTAGAFVFGPVAVTPNSRESVLRSEDDLNFDIDESPQMDTWDQVFNNCPELSLNPVDDFFVGEDDWRIAKAGGVRVIFNNIELPGAEVTVHLIGDEFEFIESFLPEVAPDTRNYTLDRFIIWGDSAKGEPGPKRSCNSGEIELHSPSELVITAE